MGGPRRSSGVSVGEAHMDVLEQDALENAREPATEAAMRLAVTFSVNLAQALFHAPIDKMLGAAAESRVLPEAVKAKAAQAADEGLDLADITERLIMSSATVLTDRRLGRPEFEQTGEAFATLIRVAAQFMGPIKELDSSQVYAAIKAYMHLQRYARPQGQKRVSLSQMARNKIAPHRVPVNELRRYCRYSMAAYGALATKFLGILPRTDGKVWSNTQAIEFLTGIDTSKNLLSAKWRANWVGSIYKPGHYVLLDHERKEVIVAIRGSYRFQDGLTDCMAHDTDFNFHYDKSQDVENAQEELKEVLASVSSALDGLKSNAEAMTLGEVETGMRDATTDILQNLQGFLSRQAQLIGQEIEEALETSSEENNDESETENELNSAPLRAARRRAKKSPMGPLKAPSRAHKTVPKDLHLQTEDSAPDGHRFIKGRTHFGFLKAAQTLASELEDLVVKAMEEHKGYKLVLVGHSLGSAVATLMTLMWSKIPQLSSARCYGVAAPPTLNLEIAKSAIATAKVTSIVYSDDLVPRMSFGAISDLRNSIEYVASEKVKGDKQGRTVAQFVNDSVKQRFPEEKLCSMFKPIMEAVRKTQHVNDKLYVAGTIYHIEHRNATVETAKKKTPKDISELLISEGMFIAHVPHSYAFAICNEPPINKRLQMSRIQSKQ